jgi:DHA1 family bicyclomycin/chloramphenicol resistance-like MFS transporter
MGCAAAPGIRSLIALRFLQGLGATGGTVIARSIIRDLHSGAAAARLMATMYLVLGVSPVLAPLAGSLLLHLVGWRGLFLVIAGLVVASALLLAVVLPETHPPAKRVAPAGRRPLADFRRLLADHRFVRLVLASAGSTSSAFVFVAGAPFVLAHHYGLSPAQFSALLGGNAAGQILSTQLAPLLMRRLGAARLLLGVTSIAALAGAVLLAAVLAAHAPLALLVALCLTVACCVGLWLTPSAVTALDAHPEIAGSAAGLLSTAQLAIAAVVTGLASLLERGDGTGIAGGYLLCGGLAHLLCRRAFARSVPR